jgi:hypothetical protein
MIDKFGNPLEAEDIIVTTKDTSHKKANKIQQETEYPSDEFMGIMASPPVKKYKNSKIASLNKLKPKEKESSLRSSLPTYLRDNSYFDNQEQCRVLLDEVKAGTYEKDLENKLKGTSGTNVHSNNALNNSRE